MPAGGESVSREDSRIQDRSGNDMIRRGGTTSDTPARPVPPIGVTLIGSRIVNVCTEAVRNRTAGTPRRFSPSNLARCDSAMTTPSSIQSACHRRTRRYADFIGTLVPLWQRQNDVNSALAARRPITAASPTRAAVNFAFRISRCHTRCVPRAEDDCKRVESVLRSPFSVLRILADG